MNRRIWNAAYWRAAVSKGSVPWVFSMTASGVGISARYQGSAARTGAANRSALANSASAKATRHASEFGVRILGATAVPPSVDAQRPGASHHDDAGLRAVRDRVARPPADAPLANSDCRPPIAHGAQAAPMT